MMFQDSKGNIWFGTENGAFRLSDQILVNIDGIKTESGKGVTIKDIAEDGDGIIWIGHSGGISRVDGEDVRNFFESDGLISHDVWCISPDNQGNIWIGTIAGVCKFDGQTFERFELPEGKVDSTLGISSKKMVHDIVVDRNGKLWFSTNAGLFSYANNQLMNVSAQAGIQTNFINSVFVGKAGEIWLSTKSGLYHLNGNKAIHITAGKIEDGKGIGSIAQDAAGKIWFVSNQHQLYTFDGNELKEFQKSAENSGPVIFQIYLDQADRLWFVGYGGAFRLENGQFINITRNGPW